MHYHLIGIAGTAMASLAGLLRARGDRVTGSDQGVYPPMSLMLDDLGIEYADRYDPANLAGDPDVVVVGNAIGRGNPELEEVLDRRLRYTSAAAVIKERFLAGRHVVAVAGTHGKTTTASLVAWLLEAAGLDPSFLIGGIPENFGISFRLTDSEFFVIEADEYDTAYFDKGPKMWHYLPWTAVVNNVEFDHADIFRDNVAYRFAFERFINLVPRAGTLVAGWDSAALRAMCGVSRAPVQSFGIGVGVPDTGTAAAEGAPSHPRWRAERIRGGEAGTRFAVRRDGTVFGELEMRLAGDFNVLNALAAMAAAAAAGAPWDAIREGLGTFRGVRRRMEVRGEAGGVTVVDDFAHHPTAVAATLKAARQRFRGRRLIAVVEPRSYTAQRREYQEAYGEALAEADHAVVAGLFRPERYDDATRLDPLQLIASLLAQGVEADYEPAVDGIVKRIVRGARPGDVVLIMSNGGFGGIHERLLAGLAAGDVEGAPGATGSARGYGGTPAGGRRTGG
ncbi:MAG: UDP-N-acetylmuramate:L-alanyl-gamma-D-glutamyl-meso-diaminopimelate ligase [Gammaproteobacteria bacterium]|nr:UDP-N-acetylmuramate:L-alanyl-gamma-D-glutamyl-meso-diaminopimelate ligase [Gammaproteobacteria bacterium]